MNRPYGLCFVISSRYVKRDRAAEDVCPYGLCFVISSRYVKRDRTAEDVCPYDLCLFRCLVVDIALRRDARPRPTGLCHVGAVVFYVLPFFGQPRERRNSIDKMARFRHDYLYKRGKGKTAETGVSAVIIFS